MAGKDFLTLLLVNYGFKDIKITTYKGEFGAQGYDIDAYNKEYDEYYHEVNCEGLMYNITHIICQMQDLGIEPTYNPFPGYDYSVKEILNMFSENKKEGDPQAEGAGVPFPESKLADTKKAARIARRERIAFEFIKTYGGERDAHDLGFMIDQVEKAILTLDEGESSDC